MTIIMIFAKYSTAAVYCLSNAMHSIGQSIKSPKCPCVQLFLSYLSSILPFPSFSTSSSPFPSLFPFPSLSSSPFSFSFPFPFPFLFLFPIPLLRFAFPFPLPLFLPLYVSPFPSLPLSLSLLPSFSLCPRLCVQYLRRYISVTVPDRRMVTMNHPYEVDPRSRMIT